MQLIQRVRNSIAKRSSEVIMRADVAPLGGSSQISVVLKQLINEGELIRISEGIYAKAKRNADGKPVPAAKPTAIVDEVLKKLGIPPDKASKEISSSTFRVFVYASNVRVHRHLDLGDSCVEIVSSKRPESLPLSKSPTDLPKFNVRKYVEQLACEHHITDERSGLDNWAEAVSRAAGDSVQLDAFGRLLARLKAQHVISGIQMAHLMTSYLSEKKGMHHSV